MKSLAISTFLATVTVACTAVGAPGPTDGTSHVPGEALVTFAGGSDGEAALEAALAGALHEDDAMLGYLADFSNALGIPVRAQRLTSGREVLLEVDRDALSAALVELLRRDRDPESVRPVDTSAESPFQDPRVEVRLTFAPGSTEADLLAEARREDSAADPLDDLAEDLAGSMGLPLTASATGDLELSLQISMTGLTAELLQRLREHPDVAAAELNLLYNTQ